MAITSPFFLALTCSGGDPCPPTSFLARLDFFFQFRCGGLIDLVISDPAFRSSIQMVRG